MQTEKINKSKQEYKALVHCKLPLIREGLNEYIAQIPFRLTAEYSDLSSEGLLFKMSQAPDLIVLLANEADTDFTLSHKIKLFAPDIPLLVILPQAPPSYVEYLKEIKVNEVLMSPFTYEDFCSTLKRILNA